MRRRARGIIGTLLALLALLALPSCQPDRKTQPPPSQNVAAQTPDTKQSADLDQPMELERVLDNLDPLTVAQRIARTAKGNWLVLAPKPLDEVKWKQEYPAIPQTVTEFLDALRKAGTPLVHEPYQDTQRLYFGTKEEWAKVQARPPLEVTGLYLAAPTGEAMVRMVSDFWKLPIHADPELLTQRTALMTARAPRPEDTPANALGMLGALRGYSASMYQQPVGAGMLEFKIVERLSLEEMLQRLAVYFGGERRNVGGKWELARLSDPKKIEARIATLKATTDEAAQVSADGFSSYASRSGQAFDESSVEVMAAMGALRDETLAAFDSLALLGAPAVPTLGAYLDTGKPLVAQAALRVLSAMNLPEAQNALVTFARTLKTPPRGKPQPFRARLQTELMRALGRHPSPEITTLLTETVRDENAAKSARFAARMALAASGNLSVFAGKQAARELPSGESVFVLRAPPVPGSPLAPMTDTPANALPFLAHTPAAKGEVWAVFVSGRYGSRDDLWLARWHGGKWTEFLFTGQAFVKGRNYGDEAAPTSGSCTLILQDDRITIGPPHTTEAAEEKRLEKLYSQGDLGKLPSQERVKLMTRYAELQQRNAQYLQKTIILSLAALRKDTDGDGLTDLAETRFGLDPKKPDTDGDGLPDGKDANPLVAPPARPSDRTQLLQAVFDALYGGDPLSDPIVVIVERGAEQEFYGARGRVLRLSKEAFQRRVSQIAALRTLQFGGPQDAESTILQKDGPCLFNDDRTRAELHFWQWEGLPLDYSSMIQGMAQMEDTAMMTDYLARFEKQGDWKLLSLKPWRFSAASQALQETMMRTGQRRYAY